MKSNTQIVHFNLHFKFGIINPDMIDSYMIERSLHNTLLPEVFLKSESFMSIKSSRQ